MKNRHDLGQKKLFTVTVDHPARAKEILEQDGILQVQQKTAASLNWKRKKIPSRMSLNLWQRKRF